MSSNRAAPKKSQQEMFQFLQSDFRNASKRDDVVRCLNASRMTKTLCCDSEKYENNNICVSRNVSLSQKIDVINRIQDNPCDTTEFSATIKCSSDVCSVSMLSENVNCNCNYDVMHCQQHKQISQSYMSSIYNLWRIRKNRNLPLLVTKKAGTQWRNCFWRIFLIPFIILLLCTTICNADPNQCAVGLKTPGRTWPQGDIVLEYGQSLRILCILNKTFMDAEFPGKNASDLVFFRNQKEMESEFITIINETTISLDIEKPPPAEDMYYCRLRLQNHNKQLEAVCLNKVVVGFKPQEPRNFTCVSHNWENMICSWEPVQNYVTTTFTLVFKLPGRAGGRKLFPCPKRDKDDKEIKMVPNMCLWDTSTNPIYRQPYEYYTFILNVNNVLGNASFTYKFHHFAHVIPAKPANLSVINKTCDSALLHWSVPFPMQNFPPGLFHKITYQNQWDHQKTWQVINITNDIHVHKRYYNLTGLKYANTVYDVRVFMRSAVAAGEDKWSQFSDVTFRTPPRLPGQPPKTDIGSFEIAENSASRDVYLYWQAIPQYLENGDNFRYEVVRVEENGRKVFLFPNETTRTYAKFNGISNNNYRFEIVSTNVVGANDERAKLFVPSQFKIPHEPIAFTKIAFDGGLYELSWKAPIMNKEITNYTIFWCDNERDRPYQCTGYLDWVHVSRNTTIYNMTVPDPDKVYQFAISANTNRGSSGMVWASCTVIHNKVVGKMKSVWINRIGSDYIEVGWKLDCSDRIGIVEGFNIYYCPIVSPYDLNCKGPKLNTTIKADPHTIHGIVHNLKPYTTYMLAVAVLTKNGEGLHSDPLYNTTLEAAPTTPPQDVKITKVTNTTMNIVWKPPEAMNGVLRYYEVYYNEYSQKVEDATQIELNDLLAHTNYSISVAACTVSCSVKSPTIYQVTKIGVPGIINVPNVRFMNSSQVIVIWNKPQYAAGLLNYYEIQSNDGEIQNSTRTEAQLPIPDCKTIGQEKLYQFRVRAVNIASDNTHLKGSWSDPGEGNCYSDGPSFRVWVIIWVIGGISTVAVFLCLAHLSKRMWLKCKAMQDVEVKLPPGLAPNMKLLQKVGEQHIRQSSADSSGCSSGQESVTSSLTSDSQVSSDSGTEIDPMPVSPNKLLETLPAWESSSLRQRNVGLTRPGFTTETARWEPYVKVAKSGEPIIADTLSLARSTPNLTDSTGYTTSQHTWSSTGYISMPSSEELSSNPSPVPKETSTASGYSIIGTVKSIKSKSEDDSDLTESTADTLIPIKPESKPTNPYITLASFEQKQKDSKAIDSLHDLDELTFAESNKSKLESLTPFSTSDKVSKPYVQTGLIDSLKKPFTRSSIDSAKSVTMSTPFAATSLTDSCNKPFVSSFASPTTLASTLDSSSKPYVSVSSIPEVSKKSNLQAGALESSQKVTMPQTSTTDGSQPYVLASSVFQMLQQQQRGKPETSISEAIDNETEDVTTGYPLCWQTSGTKPNSKLDTDKSVITTKQSTGYVTIAENPKLDQHRTSTLSSPYVQHERFEKPLPQTTTGQSDEQYSKVTVVPSTIQ
ncbi:cytokine receptor [Frieseomelitta varia]|uniref:cytokine receptor n=1 Tax=Frieseomelitta varia TaxID=561572 RepID=UPI001CB69BD6|nr:cytokine receptor [Frieseomelitta varia]XP_043508866.1 cytokine receptor [Frieseomelitta varia]